MFTVWVNDCIEDETDPVLYQRSSNLSLPKEEIKEPNSQTICISYFTFPLLLIAFINLAYPERITMLS